MLHTPSLFLFATVDDVALHVRLQGLSSDAHTCWADWVLVLAAAVTATLPRRDRCRHLPAARCAVDQTDQRVHAGLPKFSRRRLRSSRSPTNRSWVGRVPMKISFILSFLLWERSRCGFCCLQCTPTKRWMTHIMLARRARELPV